MMRCTHRLQANILNICETLDPGKLQSAPASVHVDTRTEWLCATARLIHSLLCGVPPRPHVMERNINYVLCN